MLELIVKYPGERVCGTCDNWEGAREYYSGRFHLLSDSEGICRLRAEQHQGFLETLVPAGRECAADCWRPAQKLD